MTLKLEFEATNKQEQEEQQEILSFFFFFFFFFFPSLMPIKVVIKV